MIPKVQSVVLTAATWQMLSSISHYLGRTPKPSRPQRLRPQSRCPQQSSTAGPSSRRRASSPARTSRWATLTHIGRNTSPLAAAPTAAAAIAAARYLASRDADREVTRQFYRCLPRQRAAPTWRVSLSSASFAVQIKQSVAAGSEPAVAAPGKAATGLDAMLAAIQGAKKVN